MSGAWPDRGGEEIHPQCSAGRTAYSAWTGRGGERTARSCADPARLSQPALGLSLQGPQEGAEGRLVQTVQDGGVCAFGLAPPVYRQVTRGGHTGSECLHIEHPRDCLCFQAGRMACLQAPESGRGAAVSLGPGRSWRPVRRCVVGGAPKRSPRDACFTRRVLQDALPWGGATRGNTMGCHSAPV